MAKQQAAVKEEVKATSTAVAVKVQLPAYMQESSRGNEEVTAQDIIIPRVEVAQGLSPCLDPTHAQYIKGAVQGDLYNSLTREIYGKSVNVVPVMFNKAWLVWRDRKKGGGFRGAHASVEEANVRIAGEENPEEYEALETGQNLVLIAHEDGRVEEAMLSMARTKLKVARNWNSLIRLNGGDRFSRVYALHSVSEKNATNQAYFNFGFILVPGFTPELVYKQAEALYTTIASGDRKVAMDTGDLDDESGDAAPAAAKAPTEY